MHPSKTDSMVDAQQYRITHQVPLVRIEAFCRSLETVLTGSYQPDDVPRIWRLYISAECPLCGILICGDELHALAHPPCAELASAKTGRMRLGDCARRGCNAWHYSVHLWKFEGMDWPGLLQAAEKAGQEVNTPGTGLVPRRFAFFKQLVWNYAHRTAAVLGLVFTLWIARQLYYGGRIPFLREPEKFRHEELQVLDADWPMPVDWE